MLKIDKILFPTDFSTCAAQALEHAIYLAKTYDSELHMLHIMQMFENDPRNPAKQFPDIEKVQEMLEESAATRMAEDLKLGQAENLRVKQVRERGVSPAPAIFNYAKKNGIDLIVMGTHGRRGLEHMFLGSVAEEVIRISPCPVLTIREREKPIPIERVDDVLVPIDFSDHSKSALKYAIAMAAAYHTKLHLLHVVDQPIPPSLYASGFKSMLEIAPDVEQKVKQELERWVTDLDGPLDATSYHVIDGRATTAIVKFAQEKNIDLIVISTHGLTSLKDLFLGSVSEKVVRRASCPVLTVRAFGKSLLKSEAS